VKLVFLETLELPEITEKRVTLETPE